jgi:hypothetical protein
MKKINAVLLLSFVIGSASSANALTSGTTKNINCSFTGHNTQIKIKGVALDETIIVNVHRTEYKISHMNSRWGGNRAVITRKDSTDLKQTQVLATQMDADSITFEPVENYDRSVISNPSMTLTARKAVYSYELTKDPQHKTITMVGKCAITESHGESKQRNLWN